MCLHRQEVNVFCPLLSHCILLRDVSKRTLLLAPWTTFPKAQHWWSRPPTLLDDVHKRRWLFFGRFGPDVAFPTKPQRLPFLRRSAEFSWGLSLFVNGFSRLHAGSVILGFFQVAPSLRMKMGLEIGVVTNRMRVPSASTDGQVLGRR